MYFFWCVDIQQLRQCTFVILDNRGMFGSILLTIKLDFIKSDRRGSMSTDLSFRLVMFSVQKGVLPYSLSGGVPLGS